MAATVTRMVLTGVLACLAVAGCSQPSPVVPSVSPGSTPSPTQPRVTVRMFSGREDPAFTLDGNQVSDLEECLVSGDHLTTAEPPANLGFRYFDVAGLAAQPIWVGVEGVWSDQGGGRAVGIPGCGSAFSILRAAAASALPAELLDAIPES